MLEDVIKMDLEEIGYEEVVLTPDPMAGSWDLNIEPSGFVKGGEFHDELSDYYFSRRALLYGIMPTVPIWFVIAMTCL
jgi:hypothetical protein